METPISQVLYEAGQKIATSSESLADALNETLNQLLPWPFHATKGSVRDAGGQTTNGFATVIQTTTSQSDTDDEIINADNVACVIDVVESIGVEEFHNAYERIACVKRLKKTPLPPNLGIACTTVTLGIIIAREAEVPIQLLAEKLDHLNSQHEDSERTDMVVVLTKGIINYAVQFPGEGIAGDFLPPAEDALTNYTPPIYVLVLVRPTGLFSFNKMYSFLLGYLAFVYPGVQLLEWNKILEGTPDGAIIISGYQYNLAGKLMSVPPEYFNDRYIPPRPFLIEDQRGELLSALQFLPWQDGGVVLLKGKLPLNALLIFLGKDALERGGVVNIPDGQISYVLPIAQADFVKMLQCIQRQSNMNVRQDPSTVVIQKMMEEGTRSPFIARLYFGVLRLRDVVFTDYAEREKFDTPYSKVMEALLSSRSASRTISSLVADHFSKLVAGEIGHLRGHNIYVDTSIDEELRKELGTFLNSSVRALKNGMQSVTKALGMDIGFLFKKQPAFQDGIRKLEESGDRQLAGYLRETRVWSERLLRSRNALEHEKWTLPVVKYSEHKGGILGEEPEISEQKVSDFVTLVFDRLICFVEEITVHCLEAHMPTEITISEIELSTRESSVPLRFQLALKDDGVATWRLQPHQNPFEDT